MELMILRS